MVEAIAGYAGTNINRVECRGIIKPKSTIR